MAKRQTDSLHLHTLFSTLIYQSALTTQLRGANKQKNLYKLNDQLVREAHMLAHDDRAGQVWSEKFYRRGFTTYGSQDQLFRQSPTFAELGEILHKHVGQYLRDLQLDCKATDLELVSQWVNIMPPGAQHSMHMHPNSVISGTYYLQTPPQSSPLKLADPRFSLFMNRPQPLAKSKNQPFFYIQPKVGDVVLFESWQMHEVPENTSEHVRVSVSFNFNWKRQ